MRKMVVSSIQVFLIPLLCIHPINQQICNSSSCPFTVDDDIDSLVRKLHDTVIGFASDLETIRNAHHLVQEIKSSQTSEMRSWLSTEMTQKEANRFIAWGKNKRYLPDGLEVRQIPGFGFGVFATKNFPKYANVTVIPSDTAFTTALAVETLDGCLEDIDVPPEEGHTALWSNVYLTLLLLIEWHKGNASEWKEYIDALPRKHTHPVLFDSADFQLLQESMVSERSRNYYVNVLAMYTTVWNHLANSSECQEKTGLFLRHFSLEDFRWAYVTVLTRNYNGDFRGQLNEPRNKVMLPLWDCINHNFRKAHVDIYNRFNESANIGYYITFTKKPIEAGEEVYFSYLHKPDPIQTFTVWNFPENELGMINFIFNPEDQFVEEKKKIVSHVTQPMQLQDTNPALPNQQRLLDATSMAHVINLANGAENTEWNRKTVSKAWLFLAEQIDRNLQQRSRNIQSLHKLLDKTKKPSQRLILNQMIGEQAFLIQAKNYCFSQANAN